MVGVCSCTPAGVQSQLDGGCPGALPPAKFRCPFGTVAGALALLLINLLHSAIAQDSVRTLAGLPETPGSADGTNTTARFNDPAGIAIAADGTIFVADNQNHAIRRIATNGVVTTFAGLLGTPGSTDGSGSTARFDSPTSLAFGPDGAQIGRAHV